MAVLELPALTDGTPHYTFRTQLEGVDYQFTMRFGERRGCWVLDIATLDGVEILTGQVITIGRDLLLRASMPERPPGVLWAVNVVTPTEADGGVFALPGLYDLGPSTDIVRQQVGAAATSRCRLYYTESAAAEQVVTTT